MGCRLWAVYQHDISRLEVTIEEALLVTGFCQVLCQQAKVGLQLHLMEVYLRSFQETVFKVVEIEEYGVGIKLRLRIAVSEVKLMGTTQLDIRQLTDGTAQQFLLLQRITATCLTTTTDGIEQRHGTQIRLNVAQLIIADSKNRGNRQLTFRKMLGQIDKGMILVTAGTHTAYDALTLRRGHAIVLTITSTSRQLLYILGLFPTPPLV